MEIITPAEFSARPGTGDWGVVLSGATARFATGSFAAGVEFVADIGRLADAADHHPDVDLRYSTVTVRVLTHDAGDLGGLTDRDADLARAISEAAADRGIAATSADVRDVQVTIDAMSIADVLPFWQAVLDYRSAGPEDLLDPAGRGPSLWFQQMDAPRTERNRLHIDVSVPPDAVASRIEAALAAGGTLLTDAHAPSWWVLADPEGNEACVTSWEGRF